MMGIRPLFDVNNNIILPTVVLCSRNGHKLGTIFPVGDFEITPDIHGINECSFKVYKEVDGIQNPLWNQIQDLKLIYMPEYDEYFQIAIDKESSDKTVKSITAENLGVAELSQTMLYDMEINTENDIARDDYQIATIYDPENPSSSLLGRVLSKAPHYRVKHVDAGIAGLVRSFSIDNKSIYDFLTGDLADELNCLVIAGSDRTVSLYDLDEYGANTSIYVSVDNLSDSISLDSNTDEVKNTFRVRGGDDLINAAVRAINPNGTEYIHRFSDLAREDMPTELVNKLDSYQELYESKTPSYKQAMTNIYEAVDEILYLTSEMMPSPDTDDTNANKELAKLTKTNIGNPAVQNLKTAGEATVNNAIKGVIQIFMRAGYDAGIYSSSYTNGVWTGKFKVQNTNDETDFAVNTNNITLTITDDYEAFILQKLKKSLAGNDVDISKAYDWTLYGLNRLSSFSDAYQACLDILIETGVGEPSHEFHQSIYVPFYNKKLAVDAEISVRERQIKAQEFIQAANEKIRDSIQEELNFEDYLGQELYLVYCSYRREDTYRNDNYVSDGLSNSELLEKAEELLAVAQKELYKASELQYSITTTIGNLFALKEFEPLKSQFQVGNWLRVEADGEIYKLRLIDYTIRDGDISTLQCNFSSATKLQNGVTDVKSVLANAKSMASSYASVKRQSKRGSEVASTVKAWTEKGMNATAVAISDSENQTVVYDGHGILCREYDDITETYADEQLKIVNNTLAVTDDSWQTVKSAIGKIYYEDPEESGALLSAYGVLAECLVGKLILGEALGIYNTGGSMQFTADGLKISNGTNTFIVNPNADKLFTITKGETEILSVDKYGNGSFSGSIYANSGKIGGDNGWTIGANALYNGCDSLSSAAIGTYVGADGIRQYKDAGHFVDIRDGILTAQNVNISGTINSNNANITGGSIHISTGSLTDVIKLSYLSNFCAMNPMGFHTTVKNQGTEMTEKSANIINSNIELKSETQNVKQDILTMSEKHFAIATKLWNSANSAYDDQTTHIRLNNRAASFDVPVYTFDGTMSVSDRDLKNSIAPLPLKKSAEFIYSLIPSAYKLNNGASGRYHHGFIAQQLKEAMDDNDWGVYVDTSVNADSDTKGYKAIRYEEIIADLVAAVQSQNERITKLENQLALMKEEF